MHHQGEALRVVADFLGLSHIDWAAVKVGQHSFAPKMGQQVDAIPIQPDVLEQLREFYERHGDKEWTAVQERGYTGCKPDVV